MNTVMLRSPISRMGGKYKLRKEIIKRLPQHTCYCELFFGAGWVYFGKEPSKVEVINDIDSELINLFKTLKYHAPEVERLLEYEFSGRDIFEEYKHATLEHLTEIHRAVRFLYLNNISFGSRGNTYGYGTTRPPSSRIYCTEHLKSIKERLKNTYVENLSFETVIDKYDSLETVFFADPPYFETCGYTGIAFNEDEHIKLRDKLSAIKGKFLLTINDCQQAREWYNDYKIEPVEVRYSVGRENSARRNFGELIISNFRI